MCNIRVELSPHLSPSHSNKATGDTLPAEITLHNAPEEPTQQAGSSMLFVHILLVASIVNYNLVAFNGIGINPQEGGYTLSRSLAVRVNQGLMSR